jgi:3-hydroxy acid dehydrogenase / malonic semialdehyde reductase
MKTILITGASSGIGKACAEKLVSIGTNFILCSRNIKELQNIKKKLEKKHVKVAIYKVDIQQRNLVEAMFDDLEKRKIKIDILINNAGLALDLADIKDGNPEDWDVMIDTNIKGLLYITRRAIKQMIEKNFGHIINIGSIAGIHAYPKGAVYAATKSAVKFISDGLRKELIEKNIKVTNIQPGLVETNFSNVRFYGDKKRAKNVYTGIEPLKAKDIADAIFYAITRPKHVQLCEMIITPLHQASVDTIYKKE